MDTKRETKEITTSGNHKVVIKTYATGREFNEIQNCYLKDAKLNVIGGVTKIEGFSPTSEFEATKKTLELLVVSLDGIAENLVDRILDLRVDDYNEIVEALKEVSGQKKTPL